MKIEKYLLCLFLLTSVNLNCWCDEKQDLEDNYIYKQREINSLIEYVKVITSDTIYFDIEFENDKTISRFFVSIKRIYTKTGISSITNIVANGDYNSDFSSNRNLDIESKKLENLLNQVGWTKENLKILKQKLDNANCISVESSKLLKSGDSKIDNPITIGYKRVGLGMYFYKVFNHSLSDSLINKYDDGCNYIYYQDNIVFEYRGGAVGRQCFKK